jgi:8-oxo-dGTP diphosphatase
MGLPKTPALITDCAIFNLKGEVTLIRRKHEPFAGYHALPGGFVEIGETVEAACRREVLEESGLQLSDLKLVGVYSDPNRDPRGHVVSVAYTTRLETAAQPRAGSDALSAEWIKDWRSHSLAFDHAEIIADAERLLRRVTVALTS